MKSITKLYMVALPLSLLACQEQQREEKGLAATHPALAEDLAEDSVQAPNTNTTSQLYDRYRITTEEYFNSSKYSAGNMYGGKLAPLDEKSHSDAATYRSTLQKGMEEGVNFAGKYTVVTIGCGTTCQQHYVVDRQTGKITDRIQSSMGAKYNANSKIFVINPPDESVNYNECSYCSPEAYVLEKGKFVKLED